MSRNVEVLFFESETGNFLTAQGAINIGQDVIDVNLVQVTDPIRAHEMLATNRFDLLMLDLGEPQANRLDLLTDLQRTAPDIPVIAFADSLHQELAVDSVKLGADDYILTEQLGNRFLCQSVISTLERRWSDPELRHRGPEPAYRPDPIRSLALRSNFRMGNELSRLKLAEPVQVKQCHPDLYDHLESNTIKRGSLLKILTWDLNLIEEKTILDYTVEEFSFGFFNLTNYEIDRSELPDFRLEECWATMTLPFDLIEKVFFVSTCSYLSSDAVKHWERRLSRNISWFVCDLSTMTMALENLERAERSEKESQEPELREV